MKLAWQREWKDKNTKINKRYDVSLSLSVMDENKTKIGKGIVKKNDTAQI
jgi:hypothetical protein